MQKERKGKRETRPRLEMESWAEMFFPKIIKSLLTSRRNPEDVRERSVKWIVNRIDGRILKLF